MNFKTKLLFLELFSLVVTITIITAVNLVIINDEVGYRIEETLQVAVEGYYGDVNYLKNSGRDIEITVFEGDTRVDSSISGVIGTKADSEIVNTVINNSETYFTKDVLIGGEKYYGYYKPYEDGMLFAGKPKTVVSSLLTVIASVTIGISVAICLYFMWITSFTAKKMSKALIQAKDQIDMTANLNLSFTENMALTKRSDEIGSMSKSIMQLLNHLKEIISEINDQSQYLDSVCSDFQTQFSVIEDNVDAVNTAMEEVAQGSTLQATETVSTSTQVAEMTDVIDQSIHNVTNLKDAMVNMTGFSSDTQSTLSDLKDVSEGTISSVRGVADQIHITNVSVENIKKAVEMIQDITSQTNLLSMNASIEAAHAGEAGKGFAVVADEIKKLADSSSNSAKEIEDIVDEILKNFEDSMNKIAVVNEDINAQKEKLNNTVESFGTLQVEITNMEAAIDNILSQMNHLDSLKTAISNSTEQLAAISQENAASSEEVSASMHTLTGIVAACKQEMNTLANADNTLKEQIGKFTL